MSVTNVSLPINRAGMLSVTSILFGIEPVQVDQDGNTLYVDLFGDEDKALLIAQRVGATVLDVTLSIPGEPEGVGVENENASGRVVYADLMGKPNFK